MNRILGIDPGPKTSDYVVWDGKVQIIGRDIPNDVLLEDVCRLCRRFDIKHVAIERVRGYGLPGSNDLFDTIEFYGRLWDRLDQNGFVVILVPRKDAVAHICDGNRQAGDKGVNQALEDRFGGKGTRKDPGPLNGISGSHLKAALSVAVYAMDHVVGKEAKSL